MRIMGFIVELLNNWYKIDNQWHHIAIINSVNKVCFYFDGKEIISLSI